MIAMIAKKLWLTPAAADAKYTAQHHERFLPGSCHQKASSHLFGQNKKRTGIYRSFL